jgi:hypothetical protein
VPLAILIGLAFALRIHNLGMSPLRGDEALTVRYWAASPAETLRYLAWVEPHPFGAFFGFWLWKSLVGGSEFAMRMLPTLVNVLGIPAMYGVSRRLFAGEQSRYIALTAAFLWAVNPYQIWHAQDVRNYAIWSGLSVLALWLLLRASDRDRRLDWVLYVVAVTLALYVFFLEAFVVVVHGLCVIVFRRRVFRAWIAAMLIVGVVLIPWFGQIWALARSGYSGTGSSADLRALVFDFWPSLLVGEQITGIAISFAASGAWLLGLFSVGTRRARFVLAILLVIPSALLFVSATRLNVFMPRYLMAAVPAIMLSLAYVLVKIGNLDTWRMDALRRMLLIAATVFVILLAIPTVGWFVRYYQGGYAKAPNWRDLRDYLRAVTSADDAVIVASPDQTGTIDPAFEYYYNGPAQVFSLPNPAFGTLETAKRTLDEKRAVWFVGVGSNTEVVNAALSSAGTLITTDRAGDFPVWQYRARQVKPLEIEVPLNLSIGGINLRGYSLIGPRTPLTVLLYWEGEVQAGAGLKTFVHLVGTPKPDGSALWAQDDHLPTIPGRDVYRLQGSVLPGTYTVVVGLYDPVSGKRAPVIDLEKNTTLGDSYTLATITLTP